MGQCDHVLKTIRWILGEAFLNHPFEVARRFGIVLGKRNRLLAYVGIY
jgi:hypothetical protein